MGRETLDGSCVSTDDVVLLQFGECETGGTGSVQLLPHTHQLLLGVAALGEVLRARV